MLDATRVTDGAMVMLKRVSSTTYPQELQIHHHLLSAQVDGMNESDKHIVPIYAVLQVPDSSSESIIVMPYLRPSSDPEFNTVEEAVEFFRQVFKVSITNYAM